MLFSLQKIFLSRTNGFKFLIFANMKTSNSSSQLKFHICFYPKMFACCITCFHPRRKRNAKVKCALKFKKINKVKNNYFLWLLHAQMGGRWKGKKEKNILWAVFAAVQITPCRENGQRENSQTKILGFSSRNSPKFPGQI